LGGEVARHCERSEAIQLFVSRKGTKAQRKGAILRAFAPSRETISFSGLLRRYRSSQ
jgi:hypothetical protein